MSMKLNFLQDVLVLPASVLTHAAGANDAYFRVLLWLASDLSLAGKTKQLSKLADCDAKTVKEALTYWQTCGVLSVGDDAESTSLPAMAQPQPAAAAPEPKQILQRANELPNYTTTELATLLESREEMRVLIDEAQRLLGKIFNTADVNIMVGMLDYLGMSGECVLLLFAHCKRIEKTSMRAIEKYAIALADRGITEASAMEEELRILEELYSFEGEVRKLFGLKSRSLTSKESKQLRAWSSYGYGIDIVKCAYELTVNATGEASLPYANAILERWHSEELSTLEEIQARLAEEKAQKEGDGPLGKLGDSFGTEDFFEVALKRSLKNLTEP